MGKKRKSCRIWFKWWNWINSISWKAIIKPRITLRIHLLRLASLCIPLLSQLIKMDTSLHGRKILHQKCQNLIYHQMHQMMDPKLILLWMMHSNHRESLVLVIDCITLISKNTSRRWLMHALQNFISIWTISIAW